jgi:hypothetical protein
MDHEFNTILLPYLIQRGSFRGTKEEAIIGLDSLMDYDYMGSSEFEFGALPASLKRITASWSEYVWFPIEEIKDADGQFLYVLCRKRQEAEVVKVVKLLAQEDGAFRTKERVGLHDYIACSSEFSMRINFWWDITSDKSFYNENDLGEGNDWMICFGNNNIRHLIMAIKKVCEKHKVSDNGPTIPPLRDGPVRSELLIENNWNKNVTISYPDGKKTVILKRKIVEVDNSNNDVLKILVQTRSGSQKWVEIVLGLSSTRSLLWNILKDWPEINKIKG